MNTFINRGMFLPAGCTPDFGEKQGELKNKYENQWVFHGFEVLATCRFLTAGPTTPLASLKLELWHLSFCNVKHATSLLVLFWTTVIFLLSRATKENHGYPDLLHYSSATLERDCCSQHVLDHEKRNMMN